MTDATKKRKVEETDDAVKLYEPSWTCSICLEILGQSAGLLPCIITPCAHSACYDCIIGMEKSGAAGQCPICRKEFQTYYSFNDITDSTKDKALAEKFTAIRAAKKPDEPTAPTGNIDIPRSFTYTPQARSDTGDTSIGSVLAAMLLERLLGNIGGRETEIVPNARPRTSVFFGQNSAMVITSSVLRNDDSETEPEIAVSSTGWRDFTCVDCDHNQLCLSRCQLIRNALNGPPVRTSEVDAIGVQRRVFGTIFPPAFDPDRDKLKQAGQMMEPYRAGWYLYQMSCHVADRIRDEFPNLHITVPEHQKAMSDGVRLGYIVLNVTRIRAETTQSSAKK